MSTDQQVEIAKAVLNCMSTRYGRSHGFLSLYNIVTKTIDESPKTQRVIWDDLPFDVPVQAVDFREPENESEDECMEND